MLASTGAGASSFTVDQLCSRRVIVPAHSHRLLMLLLSLKHDMSVRVCEAPRQFDPTSAAVWVRIDVQSCASSVPMRKSSDDSSVPLDRQNGRASWLGTYHVIAVATIDEFVYNVDIHGRTDG